MFLVVISSLSFTPAIIPSEFLRLVDVDLLPFPFRPSLFWWLFTGWFWIGCLLLGDKLFLSVNSLKLFQEEPTEFAIITGLYLFLRLFSG